MKKTNINLIPDKANTSPDYYCTWQTQLYATSDGKPEGQRKRMDAEALFSEEKPLGFAYFYPRARRDLMILMDDSWDVPYDGNPEYYGSLVLSAEKFPEFSGNGKSNAEALGALNEKIKSIGWRGVGGWVCAQQSDKCADGLDGDEYWIKRLKEADASGFSYWKADWGKLAANYEFRVHLAELARTYAPNLVLENAILTDTIPYSDAFRTYDVPEIMSIPMTMEKLKSTLSYDTVSPAKGIINAEDEVYIAAALGCAMGIMRHPYAGNFPNGKPDMSFPECHRDVKRRIDETARAARWHRLAPAFGANGSQTHFSEEKLTDFWQFENYDAEIEAWWLNTDAVKNSLKDGVLTMSAVSAISRGLPLPKVSPDADGNIPYAAASKNPNGTVSIATLGRTLGRKFYIPKCNIGIEAGDADTFGIFGEYANLEILCTGTPRKILAQDILSENACDITEDVLVSGGRITVGGELIEKIGRSENAPGDISDPGIALKLVY